LLPGQAVATDIRSTRDLKQATASAGFAGVARLFLLREAKAHTAPSSDLRNFLDEEALACRVIDPQETMPDGTPLPRPADDPALFCVLITR
jgi:hypothetical protein